MSRKAASHFREELKNVVELQRHIDAADPTAWAEYVTTLIEIAEANPKVRSGRYMTDELTSLLLKTLEQQRKPIRYPRNVYHGLITKVVLLHSIPLMALAVVEMAMNAEDPTALIEEMIQFSEFAGAKFRRCSDGEHRNCLLNRARQSMGKAGHSVDESMLLRYSEDVFRTSEGIRAQNLSFDRLVELAIRDVYRLLRKRDLALETKEWYCDRITYVMAVSEDPESTAGSLIADARYSPDPTSDIEAAKTAAKAAAHALDLQAFGAPFA